MLATDPRPVAGILCRNNLHGRNVRWQPIRCNPVTKHRIRQHPGSIDYMRKPLADRPPVRKHRFCKHSLRRHPFRRQSARRPFRRHRARRHPLRWYPARSQHARSQHVTRPPYPQMTGLQSSVRSHCPASQTRSYRDLCRRCAADHGQTLSLAILALGPAHHCALTRGRARMPALISLLICLSGALPLPLTTSLRQTPAIPARRLAPDWTFPLGGILFLLSLLSLAHPTLTDWMTSLLPLDPVDLTLRAAAARPCPDPLARADRRPDPVQQDTRVADRPGFRLILRGHHVARHDPCHLCPSWRLTAKGHRPSGRLFCHRRAAMGRRASGVETPPSALADPECAVAPRPMPRPDLPATVRRDPNGPCRRRPCADLDLDRRPQMQSLVPDPLHRPWPWHPFIFAPLSTLPPSLPASTAPKTRSTSATSALRQPRRSPQI